MESGSYRHLCYALLLMNKRPRSVDYADGADSPVVSKCVSVLRSTVPAYLRDSDFFTSLLDDDDVILVPSDCLKEDSSVNSVEDLRHLLLSLRFWVAPATIKPLLDFAFSQPVESWDSVLVEFQENFPALMHIKIIREAKSKNQMMLKAIQSGVAELLAYLHSLGYSWPKNVVSTIASTGNVPMLELAMEAGHLLTADAYARACSSGHLNVLKFLHAKGCPWGKAVYMTAEERSAVDPWQIPTWGADACSYAASSGHLDCLRYAHENGAPWNEATCEEAAENGHLDCLAYAHENGCPWNANPADPDDVEWSCGSYGLNVCTIAAGKGHVDCLRYAHTHGAPFVREACVAAARKGHKEVIRYALQQGVQLLHVVSAAAMRYGDLEFVKLVHESGCPWHRQACLAAVSHGDEGRLQYAHDHGAPWDEDVMFESVGFGSIEYMEYLLRNGCPICENPYEWPSPPEFQTFVQAYVDMKYDWALVPDITLYAVKNRLFEGLRFLIEHRCPWHPRCILVIIMVGRVDLLQYALEQGCDLPIRACEDLMTTCPVDLACIQFLHEHGCRFSPPQTLQAARVGKLDVLQYLHEQGCAWDGKVANVAAKYGHAECLEYVLSHGCARGKDAHFATKNSLSKECMVIAQKYGCI